MPELSQKERLQPCLLDRLTDDEPQKLSEPRDKRIMTIEQLRNSVIRDLSWLMNTENLESAHDLVEFPLVSQSTLNYGLPVLSGHAAATLNVFELEQRIRNAILNFEPRILADSLTVRAIYASQEMSKNALNFEIDGDLWAEPTPMRFLVHTELDLESGTVKIIPRER